ncbi:ATP-binding protein [Caballeronia sordidicola]|uniref:ATP-binding protein n=1 Tax=Caballeronia sordidicola TaxID=196367 RepID=UPI0004CFF14E|nr:ATP-binding protein [Caballeronia sordidicola]
MPATRPSATALRFAARMEQHRRRNEPDSAQRHDEGAQHDFQADQRETAVQARFDQAEERAAVSGLVDPRDLLDPEMDESMRSAVLGRLARACEIRSDDHAVQWIMTAGQRTRVLQRLMQEKKLASMLSSSLPPTDMFGNILRRCLAGADLPFIDLADEAAVLAVSSAIEILADLGYGKFDAGALTRRISRDRYRRDYDTLLRDGFLGRESQLELLRGFTDAKSHNEASGPGSGKFEGLVLSGLGGVGKSTLLAHWLLETIHAARATPVILDFDRPGIDPSDLSWLEAEITRQIGYQYPETAAELARIRAAIRERKRNAAYSEGVSSHRGISRSYRALHNIRDALQQASPAGRPFIVVLDTFEEVAQRHLIDSVVSWLLEMQQGLGEIALRVVFSGRLFGRSIENLALQGIERVIPVGDFNPHEAECYLKGLGVDGQWARQIAYSEVLPLRPLELKLLARIAMSDGAHSIDEIEDEIRNGGTSAQELFAGLVYRRILLRVNEEVRALAVPGLVLRYVTTDLIQRVLVPALDLSLMNEADARRALDALAGYEWLAETRGDEVWHRRDLRRSMLKVMIGPECEKAARINKLAFAFFRERPDERSRAEACYHRLMIQDFSDYEWLSASSDLNRAFGVIGGDIVDLPPVSQAALRYAANKDIGIAEVRLLPGPLFEMAYTSVGERYVDMREFGLARRLMRLREWDGERKTPQWETHTLFSTACWSELRERPFARLPLYGFGYLADLVYPAALVAKDRPSLDDIGEALSHEPWLHRTGGAWRTHCEQFAMGIMLRLGTEPARDPIRRMLGRMIGHLADQDSVLPSPELQRAIMLLATAIREREIAPSYLLLTHLNLLLDVAGLRELQAMMTRDHAPDREIEFIAEIALALEQHEQESVASILSAVDAVAARSQPGSVLLRHGILRKHQIKSLLLGAEFRVPVCFAFIEAFPHKSDYPDLCAVFAATIPFPYAERRPDAFTNSVGVDFEHSLPNLIELADRFGILGNAVKMAHKYRPHSPVLRDVANTYDRWSHLVTDVCDYLTAP